MEDRCVMCGEYVVEGRQVCETCEQLVLDKRKSNKKNKNEKYIRMPHWDK